MSDSMLMMGSIRKPEKRQSLQDRRVKHKALGDRTYAPITQTLGTFSSDELGGDIEVFVKLAQGYKFDSNDRASLCAHNARVCPFPIQPWPKPSHPSLTGGYRFRQRDCSADVVFTGCTANGHCLHCRLQGSNSRAVAVASRQSSPSSFDLSSCNCPNYRVFSRDCRYSCSLANPSILC